MGVANQHMLLVSRQTFVPLPAVGLLVPAAPAEGVGSGIPRIAHCTTGAAQRQRRPCQLILVCAGRYSCREEQVLLPEVFDRRTQCPGSSKGLEEQLHRFLNLLVGIEHHVPGRIVNEAHRQPAVQFTAARLIKDASTQARPKDVKNVGGLSKR
jgi:hypothetical protein